jgi:hypothetical protein
MRKTKMTAAALPSTWWTSSGAGGEFVRWLADNGIQDREWSWRQNNEQYTYDNNIYFKNPEHATLCTLRFGSPT